MRKDWPVKAQTSVCDVCAMLIPLEAEVESLHAWAAAFLRPQSSSLRDHQHPAGRDRARLFDWERFKRKFVTTLADLRSEIGLRIVGYVHIPQGGTVILRSRRRRRISYVHENAQSEILRTVYPERAERDPLLRSEFVTFLNLPGNQH